MIIIHLCAHSKSYDADAKRTKATAAESRQTRGKRQTLQYKEAYETRPSDITVGTGVTQQSDHRQIGTNGKTVRNTDRGPSHTPTERREKLAMDGAKTGGDPCVEVVRHGMHDHEIYPSDEETDRESAAVYPALDD